MLVACCRVTGRKSPKPYQGWFAPAVAATRRRETKICRGGYVGDREALHEPGSGGEIGRVGGPGEQDLEWEGQQGAGGHDGERGCAVEVARSRGENAVVKGAGGSDVEGRRIVARPEVDCLADAFDEGGGFRAADAGADGIDDPIAQDEDPAIGGGEGEGDEGLAWGGARRGSRAPVATCWTSWP